MRLRDWVEIMDAADLDDDSHGNPIPDWDNAPVLREPAQVEPLSTSETTIGGDTVISRWRVVLHGATSARSDSRIRWRGDTYEVDGEVQLVSDARGRPHHRNALLRRVSE